MRAFHQGGVERNQVHQHPEAKFLLKQTPGYSQFRNEKFRIQEQFDGIVTRFAMNIDAPGKVRRQHKIGRAHV